jgi:hypothetical protein
LRFLKMFSEPTGEKNSVVPPGLGFISMRAPGTSSAGLSHAAASRLDFGGVCSTVLPETRFSRTLFRAGLSCAAASRLGFARIALP